MPFQEYLMNGKRQSELDQVCLNSLDLTHLRCILIFHIQRHMLSQCPTTTDSEKSSPIYY